MSEQRYSRNAADAPSVHAAGRLRWGVMLFAGLLVTWLALYGLQSLGFGVAAAALGTMAGLLAAPGEAYPVRLRRLPGFVLFFLRESVRGGMDVAVRALHPRRPLAPAFVEHPLRLPAGQPRTLLVGLIGLLPGSMSVEVDEARQVLLVHVLAVDGPDPVAPLERQLVRLFGLDGRA
ncbi:Na+/H+ antiporter subunit E [Azohydromonas aeria]|uniref:Na+/H+ antiporter subunit E n=1 Tax=Azohydromonas aeria TaxID=2590212 RepID=UPI0012FAB768|nr:Na+/H+ antiporter subunit E [Azohydromonas aeria]